MTKKRKDQIPKLLLLGGPRRPLRRPRRRLLQGRRRREDPARDRAVRRRQPPPARGRAAGDEDDHALLPVGETTTSSTPRSARSRPGGPSPRTSKPPSASSSRAPSGDLVSPFPPGDEDPAGLPGRGRDGLRRFLEGVRGERGLRRLLRDGGRLCRRQYRGRQLRRPSRGSPSSSKAGSGRPWAATST